MVSRMLLPGLQRPSRVWAWRAALANQYGQIGQQQYGAGQALAGAQQGYGGFLSGLGGQAQQAAQQDVASLQGIGGQAQQQRQRELDAQRAGLLQAQQAPSRSIPSPDAVCEHESGCDELVFKRNTRRRHPRSRLV
jgi:hypothetical protein